MDTTESLALARKARTDKIINRWHRDRMTGETYTIRQRIEHHAYSYRTVHTEAGKRDTYGLILAAEINGELDYMTPVCTATKLAYDYAAHLPSVTFNEDNGTIDTLSIIALFDNPRTNKGKKP